MRKIEGEERKKKFVYEKNHCIPKFYVKSVE